MEQSESSTPLKLNIGRTVLVGLAFFTICIFWQIYDNLMPLFLANFDMEWGLIGLVMAGDNILALILLPTMGRLSDRSKSKFGRRMPFIVVGSVLASITLLLVNFAHNEHILWLLLSSTIFLLVFMCLYRTPAVSLMPDITPKPIRSKANAVINIMGTLGGIVALGLTMFLLEPVNHPDGLLTPYNMPIQVVPTGNWLLISAVSVLMIIAVIIMIFTVRENEFVAKKQELLKRANINEDEGEQGVKAKGTGMTKQELRSYILILASVFLWFMGYNAASTYFSAFSLNILGEDNFSLPLIIANAAAFIMYIPASFIGTKIGRRKTILLGIAMVAGGLLLGALMILFVKDLPTLKFIMYPVFILVGAGWATINVHSYVMSVELAKKGSTGMFTGMYYTFSMGAQALTPVIAGLLFRWWDKGMLFFYSALFVGLSFITMFFVKHGNAKTIIEKDKSKLELLDTPE